MYRRNAALLVWHSARHTERVAHQPNYRQQPAMANIMDNKPFVNILPFGMCNSIANPTVAAATAAALGVLTPMPCIPATIAPWMPGSPTIIVGNAPALTAQSQLMCAWGGLIQISFPGQLTTVVA